MRVISSSAANGSSIRRICGRVDQRACDRHAHLHAAGELARIGAGEGRRARPAPATSSTRSLVSRLPTPASISGRCDVVGDGAPRQQRRLLKHKAQRRLRRAGRRHRLDCGQSMVPALGWRSRPAISFSSVDFPHPEGPSRLTNSPGRMRQIDIGDGGDAIGEHLGDAVERGAAGGPAWPMASPGAASSRP